VRRCGASWCLYPLPPQRSTAGRVSPVLRPHGAVPLWLALQPYANARLCLFEVDRPESRNPIPIRRHVIDCFLEQSGIVSGYNDTALTDPGDVLLRGYLCRAAILPVSTSNTFDWLAAELDWATPGFREEAPLALGPNVAGHGAGPLPGGDVARGPGPAPARGRTAIRRGGPSSPAAR
jgi:hypothetical protein